MDIELELPEDELEALRARAAVEGISMEEAAERAVREYLAKSDHRDRVRALSDELTDYYADALRRLGE